MQARPAPEDAPPAWRVLPFATGPPAELVAAGPALLDGLAEDPVPALRWYRATSTAVVLGRGQRLPDTAAQRAAGVDVLQRASGGGAVLLTPDMLCLDVAVPAGHPLLGGDLSAVFLPVGRAWARALAALGVPDVAVHAGPAEARRRGTERQRLLAAVCYATLGRGEVTSGGRKLLGLSQRRRRAGALVQCGLLRRWRPGPLLAALGADPGDAGIADAAAGLDDIGIDVSDGAVMHEVIARLAREDRRDG